VVIMANHTKGNQSLILITSLKFPEGFIYLEKSDIE